jgi:hypothetical protein
VKRFFWLLALTLFELSEIWIFTKIKCYFLSGHINNRSSLLLLTIIFFYLCRCLWLLWFFELLNNLNNFFICQVIQIFNTLFNKLNEIWRLLTIRFWKKLVKFACVKAIFACMFHDIKYFFLFLLIHDTVINKITRYIAIIAYKIKINPDHLPKSRLQWHHCQPTSLISSLLSASEDAPLSLFSFDCSTILTISKSPSLSN